MEKEAKLRIVDIFLKYEIDDDSFMLNDYGKLSDHWETNALKLGQHWLIPNQKWHDLRGKNVETHTDTQTKTKNASKIG